MREVCAFLEDELGLVPGWLLSVPVKVSVAFAARPLLLVFTKAYTQPSILCVLKADCVLASAAQWSFASGVLGHVISLLPGRA